MQTIVSVEFAMNPGLDFHRGNHMSLLPEIHLFRSPNQQERFTKYGLNFGL